jgi:hypothetical protein
MSACFDQAPIAGSLQRPECLRSQARSPQAKMGGALESFSGEYERKKVMRG